MDQRFWAALAAFFLDTIVRWLALSRINPNVLTFMGLVVTLGPRFCLALHSGYPKRMFFLAGLVIIFSGSSILWTDK